jgi:hypothetical protein
MSDDNTASKNYHKRLQEELAEFNTPQARYQQVLDRHWQSELDFAEEESDVYYVGGFQERWSTTPSFTKSWRDRDWRIK